MPGNERGATLVVALIMLILISLIGVASLKSAALVEKMSANDHQRNLTFQASESAANVALQDDANISQALISGNLVTFPDVATNLPNTTSTVTFKTAGSSSLFGSSLGDQGFSGQRVIITSSSTLENTNAQTRTVHGIVRLVPGGAGS